MSDAPLTGRRALVTGGNRGIGRAIAQRLVADGAEVTVTARSAAARADAAAIGCAVAIADVTDQVALEQAFAAAAPVDILVNNAGIALSRPFLRHSDDDWNATIAVNLTAAFWGCRLALPGMLARGWGRIVNIASTAAVRPYPYTAAYCASKHGLIGLTRALAIETARKGVTVNAVCPGFTATDMATRAITAIEAETGRSAAEARAALERINPQNRLTEAEEVAAMVAYLCLPGSHGITGQSLIIAGGEVM